MSHRPARRNLPGWVAAVLICGAGFVITWRCSSGRIQLPVASLREAPARTADPKAPVARMDRLAEPGDPVDDERTARHFPVREAPDPTGVLASRLPEWLRFRYGHAHLAYSMESTILGALGVPVPVSEVARSCTAKAHAESVRTLDISAAIEIQGRDATVRGWGCDTSDATAIGLCDCILEHLSDDLHVRVPSQVEDKDLTPYEGMFSLRLWL
jgi:hypothetical protein